MRILIDYQGAQTGSRLRGIGRYTTALTKAMIRNRGNHEVFLLLNALCVDTVDPIKEEFSSLLPADRIVVFAAPSPVEAMAPANAWRIEAAELIREWAIDALAPDVVLVTSLFEGAVDSAVISVRRSESQVKTAVILYDLIPLLAPDEHLSDPVRRKWYDSKIESLQKSDLLLAISDSARQEALDGLSFDGGRIVPIYCAADERFKPDKGNDAETRAFFQRIGVHRSFVLCASAFEPRKNFEGLIRAYALLPKHVRKNHQLVLLTRIGPEDRARLWLLADEVGLTSDELVLPGYVLDYELVTLYSECALYVIPSFHEGFGLPALEAMCCGAVVIGSNTTSIPEVIGRKDATFDPYSDQGIASLVERALTDTEFRDALKLHGSEWSKHFSWDRSARLALNALEKAAPARPRSPERADRSRLMEKIAAIRSDIAPDGHDLLAVADCISTNERAIAQWRSARDKERAVAEQARSTMPAADDRYDEVFLKNIYRLFYNREPDESGFAIHLRAMKSGVAPHELVARLMNSEEFSKRRPVPQAAKAKVAGGPPPAVGVPPRIEVVRRKTWSKADSPRILLLKLDHIGDFVLAIDAFKLFRDTWPNAHITLLCGAWNKSLAELLGLFDSIICFGFYPDTAAGQHESLSAKLLKYRALSLGSFDLAVDLKWHAENRVLLSHTAALYRAGYIAPGVELDLALPMVPEREIKAHVGGRLLALAAAVTWTYGTPAGVARERILNGRAPVKSFRKGIVVGIAPGTGNPIKSWGVKNFAELARLLYDQGSYRFVLIGGKGDRADTTIIGQSLPDSAYVDLAGTLPIADLPPVLAGLDLFISNDTGSAHISALMGVPTLCIYPGQTSVDSWRPVGPHVVAIRRAVACAPCYLGSLDDCQWNKRCLDISPARVAAEAIALTLKAGAKRGAPDAGDKPSLQSADADRRQVICDVSDLIHYFSNSRLPTGIQRVQINITLSLLQQPDPRIDLVVAYVRPGSEAWVAIPEEIFIRIASLAVSGGDLADPAWRAALEELKQRTEAAASLVFEPGATLVNLGTSWWQPNYFLMVRNAKAQYGIRYVPFVYDCIPLAAPEHCVKDIRQAFVGWITALFLHADGYLAISQATARDFAKVARLLRYEIPTPRVVRLDGDLVAGGDTGDTGLIKRKGLDREPFVLFVGTLESRKNHLSAFNAWLAMIKKRGVRNTPTLVCVGKPGWMVEAAMARLDASDLLLQKVRLLPSVSDHELGELHQHCLFTIFPSSYEGWGLPVTESLCHGKVVLTTTVSSLPEAGGDFAEYFDHQSERDFVSKLERLIDDADYRRDREKRIREGFRPRPWREIADEVINGALGDDGQSRATAAHGEEIWPLSCQTGRYYALGQNLEMNVWPGIANGEIYRMGIGWWLPEPWGTWVKNDSCDIAFQIDAAAQSGYRVYLGLRGTPGQALNYNVLVVGTSVKVRGKLPAGQRRWISLTVPREALSEETLHLRITTTGYCDLREVSQGRDTRIVTLGVIGFFVCAENDLAAQTRFDDAKSRDRLDELAGRPAASGDNVFLAAE